MEAVEAGQLMLIHPPSLHLWLVRTVHSRLLACPHSLGCQNLPGTQPGPGAASALSLPGDLDRQPPPSPTHSTFLLLVFFSSPALGVEDWSLPCCSCTNPPPWLVAGAPLCVWNSVCPVLHTEQPFSILFSSCISRSPVPLQMNPAGLSHILLAVLYDIS